jgi:hypothetical protein
LNTRQETIAQRPFEVIAKARQIASSRGWKIQSETANELEIRTRVSVRSWGETIKVSVVDSPTAPGYSLVTVSSSARFQAYDWGKSGSNVDVMMSALTGVPVYAPPSQSVSVQTSVPVSVNPNRKFCANCGKSMPIKARFCPGCGQTAD